MILVFFNDFTINVIFVFSPLIFTIHKLQVMRQGGEDPSQVSFRDLLLRLRDLSSTQADYQLLMTRTKERAVNVDTFADAPRLFPTNAGVANYNRGKLKAMNESVAEIRALHTGKKAASAPEKEAGGLSNTVLLCRGARVMLTRNLCVKHGLVNGSIGYVSEIIYAEGSRPPSLPVCVNVKFDNYTGPKLDNGAIPIIPVSSTFQYNSSTCTRQQLPLRLAWAISIHKSQGMTLEKVVLELGDADFSPGLTYVAITRVKHLEDILFESPFPFERLFKSSTVAFKKRRTEEIRLDAMSKFHIASDKEMLFKIPVETCKIKPSNAPKKHEKQVQISNPKGKKISSAPNNVITYQPSYQFNHNLPMAPTIYKYYPVDEAWQRLVCDEFGLTFRQANGCTEGSPDQELSYPRTDIFIEPDGSCFFRCLSQLITGTQEQHSRLRSMVCDHMLIPEVDQFVASRGAYYSNLVSDARSHIDERGMRRQGIWATNAEIWTASDLLRTQIIMANTNRVTRGWELYTPRGFILGSSGYRQGHMALYINFVPLSGILNDSCDHYQVVASLV